MSLAVAIQMDPIEAINIDADFTFALALEAQARGHALLSLPAAASDVPRRPRAARARAAAGAARDAATTSRSARPRRSISRTVDVMLMRQDPPFDMAYITATHLLEHVHPRDAGGQRSRATCATRRRSCSSRSSTALMPPTLITSDREEIARSAREHKDIIVKPLYGNGGAGVFQLTPDDENLNALLEMFTQLLSRAGHRAALRAGGARRATSASSWSTARRWAPSTACRPKGEARSNLHVGGTAEKTTLTPREREICAAIGPALKRARPDLRRHRRHRRLPDRDQRHLADRHPGDRPLRRRQPGEARSGTRSRRASRRNR